MPEHAAAAEAPLLKGYRNEDQVSAETRKSKRMLRLWRQQRTGPPFIRLGKTILYPEDGFLAWLKSLEVSPVRTRRGRAA